MGCIERNIIKKGIREINIYYIWGGRTHHAVWLVINNLIEFLSMNILLYVFFFEKIMTKQSGENKIEIETTLKVKSISKTTKY
jgi:hypothetical protein